MIKLTPEDLETLAKMFSVTINKIVEDRIDLAVSRVENEVSRCLVSVAADEIRAKARAAVSTVSVHLTVE